MKYEIIDQIGSGAYATVFRARCSNSGRIVALKRILLQSEDEGIPCTAVREISLLKDLHHPNIIRLEDVIHKDNSLSLIFEYLDLDLKSYVDTHGPLPLPTIKSLLFQLLSGLECIHGKKILHRDIKLPNLLVSVANPQAPQLKIADFGLARAFGIPVKSYCSNVVTLWYRAVELMLGAVRYGPAVDMWSIGCVFAELSSGEPLFPGRNEEQQLHLIFQLLGTPTTHSFPGLLSLPGFKSDWPIYQKVALSEVCPRLDDVALDLLSRFLIFDPAQRITATEALQHPFFHD
ncbi:hypothetical protein RCL1_006444 [Eukaryota sp. TZLM3-RCL]